MFKPMLHDLDIEDASRFHQLMLEDILREVHVPAFVISATNIAIDEKWGYHLDFYLSQKYPKYNPHSQVQIVPAKHCLWGYIYHPADGIEVKFRVAPLLFTTMKMMIAYSPELDTVFIRELFTPTISSSNHPMDLG